MHAALVLAACDRGHTHLTVFAHACGSISSQVRLVFEGGFIGLNAQPHTSGLPVEPSSPLGARWLGGMYTIFINLKYIILV